MGDFSHLIIPFFPPIYIFHNKHIKPGFAGQVNFIFPLVSDQNNYAMPLCGADTWKALEEHLRH